MADRDGLEAVKTIGNTSIRITDTHAVHTPEAVTAILERIRLIAQRELTLKQNKRSGAQNVD